jgi:hypothetical protein
MGRRVFNRLVVEISLVVRHCISRRALWTHMHEIGIDPEQMNAQDAADFCGHPLRRFLVEQGIRLEPSELHKLELQLRRINPYRPDPYDRIEGLERLEIARSASPR